MLYRNKGSLFGNRYLVQGKVESIKSRYRTLEVFVSVGAENKVWSRSAASLKKEVGCSRRLLVGLTVRK